MVKVDCPSDISDAFLYTVLNYTDKKISDIQLDRIIDYISSDNISNNYVLKIEKAIRKLKIKKLNYKNE